MHLQIDAGTLLSASSPVEHAVLPRVKSLEQAGRCLARRSAVDWDFVLRTDLRAVPDAVLPARAPAAAALPADGDHPGDRGAAADRAAGAVDRAV